MVSSGDDEGAVAIRRLGPAHEFQTVVADDHARVQQRDRKAYPAPEVVDQRRGAVGGVQRSGAVKKDGGQLVPELIDGGNHAFGERRGHAENLADRSIDLTLRVLVAGSVSLLTDELVDPALGFERLPEQISERNRRTSHA